jgi:hypothetical protein
MKDLLSFPDLQILLIGTPAFVDIDKGLVAFDTGNIAIALKEWNSPCLNSLPT